MAAVRTCPGLYCGRTELIEDGSWGECGACPRGFRANFTSHCIPCDDQPSLYDWLYLGFMAFFPLILHWYFIDQVILGKPRRNKYMQHICAFVEVATGTLMALLIFPPAGSVMLSICTPKTLSDWYTLLHNPQPDYRETLHCTQEAVYPLYTIVLVIYAFSLIMTVTLRSWLLSLKITKPGKRSVYCALYFYPILALVHTVAAGLIYWSFPYIILNTSMISSALHFAYKLDQTAPGLVMSFVMDPKNIVILFAHWVTHAYGIISLTGFKDLWYLSLVPAPAIFYVLTVQFTEPSKIHSD